MKSEFERQGRKGTYIEFDNKVAPRFKVKSTSANAPRSLMVKSVWKHPDYDKLELEKVTRVVSKRFGNRPIDKRYYSKKNGGLLKNSLF